MAAAMEPDVDFVGIRIPPNATVSFGDKDKRDDSPPSSSSPDDSDSEDDAAADDAMPLVDGVALVHATQVALGPNPAPGRHTVMAVRSLGGSGKGRAFPIGTLEAGKTEQFSIDLMWSMLRGEGADGGDRRIDGGFDGDISFMHTGKSDVYITGYKTVTTLLDGEGGYSSGEDEENFSDDFSSDEEEESDDEEDEAPLGVPLAGRKDGGDFSSSDDESDDDESDDDESDEDEESGSEDEGEGGDGGGGRGALVAPPGTPAGGKRPLGGGAEESSDDDDDDDEGGERPAAAAAPPATKKVKQGGGGASSAAASASATAEAYARALRDFLEAHGPTKLGALGAAVKKPAGLPPTKLTAFLSGREDFEVDGEQRVSLRS
jgi:hypothetical protein